MYVFYKEVEDIIEDYLLRFDGEFVADNVRNLNNNYLGETCKYLNRRIAITTTTTSIIIMNLIYVMPRVSLIYMYIYITFIHETSIYEEAY